MAIKETIIIAKAIMKISMKSEILEKFIQFQEDRFP